MWREHIAESKVSYYLQQQQQKRLYFKSQPKLERFFNHFSYRKLCSNETNFVGALVSNPVNEVQVYGELS